VVDDDDVDPTAPGVGDPRVVARAAIAGDEDARPRPEAALERRIAEPVAPIEAAGQQREDVGAESLEHVREDRRRGGPVDVVVAEHDDPLPAPDGVEQPVDGGRSVGHRLGGGQPGQPGVQEPPGALRVLEAPVEEHLAHGGTHAAGPAELAGGDGVRGADGERHAVRLGGDPRSAVRFRPGAADARRDHSENRRHLRATGPRKAIRHRFRGLARDSSEGEPPVGGPGQARAKKRRSIHSVTGAAM